MTHLPSPQEFGLARMNPATGIRTSQIICVALIMGVVCFVGVTLLVPGQRRDPLISYLAVGFAVLNIVMRFVVPRMVALAQLKKLPAGTLEELSDQLFPIYQTRMIIGLAILEGAAFFNVIAYFVERQLWCLAIVALLIVLMVMMFPTINQFENWVEDVKRDLASQF